MRKYLWLMMAALNSQAFFFFFLPAEMGWFEVYLH